MTAAEYEARYADTSAREAPGNTRATVARTLAELDGYIERYAKAATLTDKADILNWTLHCVATYIPVNARLDAIASAQANLVRARAMQYVCGITSIPEDASPADASPETSPELEQLVTAAEAEWKQQPRAAPRARQIET
jgi:hypothetical protein